MRTLDQIFGTYVEGSDDKRPRTRRLTDRPGNEILFIPHHSVSRTIGSIQDTFMSTNREVCATGGCGPLVGGEDRYVMRSYARWNTERPYTTASDVDDRAITVEFADLELAYPWPVGSTAKYIAAEIAAAMHVELGMPLDTAHVLDHLQVYQRGLGSYPTQCAGEDLRSSIPWIISTAKQIVAGASGGGDDESEEDDMKNSAFIYTRAKDKRQVVLLINTGSGWWWEYISATSIVPKGNNPVAATLGTGSYAPVSEAFANGIKGSLVRAQGVDLNDADIKALAAALEALDDDSDQPAA